ncbi:hypothetical protein [Parasediminibacterium sp. JCM 36343]|uniref:hypothetical protein n=1 Tax=Parasediminibacterium sp. JCM 36343 TaxID=3374279 RepID=UPI00397BFFD2
MKQLLYLLAICLLLINSTSCKKNDTTTTTPIVTTPTSTFPSNLIFNTGFEAGTYMVSTSSQTAEFRGTDASVPAPNNWVSDFVNNPSIGLFRIYYEQGDSSQRLCSIVADPVNPSNKVMNYKINVPNIDLPLKDQYTVNGILFNKKARIQADLYGNIGLKEVYQSIRLFIPTDFNKLVNSPYPGNGDWITLFEFWNNASFVTPNYDFRFGITLSKVSSAVGSPFYFKTEGQTYDTATGYKTVWTKQNTAFLAPIGKWMTIDYYIKEGNKGTGRFYFAVTPDGGSKTVVYDLNEATCHPDDPNPDGLTEFNPIKLYGSNNIVNQMNARGGKFQVYWDDFKIWKR